MNPLASDPLFQLLNNAQWEQQEGMFLNVPAEKYHAAPGCSNSMLRNLARSPAHLRADQEGEREDTTAMQFGRIVHQMLLEPLAKPFWVAPPVGLSLRSKAGDAWCEEQAAAGMTVVPARFVENAMGATAALLRHPRVAEIFDSGAVQELSIWRRFSLGNTCTRKARLDLVPLHGNAIVDVKTCEDARPDAFASSVFNLRYFQQAAFYIDAWNDALPMEFLSERRKSAFVFIAVEKKPPYGVWVHNLAAEAILRGRSEWIRLIQKWMDCVTTGTWPCYPEQITQLDLPRWALRKSDAELTSPLS